MAQTWGRQPRAIIERLLRGAPVEVTPEPEDEAHADRVPLVDLVARVGSVALVTGASASEATSMMLRLALAFHVRLHVDVTYTSVIVSWGGDGRAAPVTLMRTVPALGFDYARLAHLQQLVEDVCTGRLDIAGATRELGRRGRVPMRYRPWVVNAAAFGQGASICALLGGITWEVLVAGLATLLIGVATNAMARQHTPYFLAQMVAGAIPTALTVALMYVRDHGAGFLTGLSPSLVVVSGMVTMLAGFGVVAASQDALDGYFVTAGARVVDLLMRTGGLTIGVSTVLWVGLVVGAPAYLSPAPLPLPPVALQVVAAALFSTFMGLNSRLGLKGAALSGLFGGLGWFTYRVVDPLVGHDYAVAVALAAILLACAAWVVASRLGLPAIALITMGVAPLMPGMFLYRGLYRLVTGDPALEPGDTSVALFLVAAGTGLGLALGSSLGSMVGRRLVQPQETLTRLASQLSLRRGRMRRT